MNWEVILKQNGLSKEGGVLDYWIFRLLDAGLIDYQIARLQDFQIVRLSDF
ncbi:MAG: hypothetical protein KDC84_05210 [Crocinitomicaceae bacterium]|nr:hypothetical protein [Crocinitomicaceae bacterium]